MSVTAVPPAVGPLAGAMELRLRVEALTKVKAFARLALLAVRVGDGNVDGAGGRSSGGEGSHLG